VTKKLCDIICTFVFERQKLSKDSKTIIQIYLNVLGVDYTVYAMLDC